MAEPLSPLERRAAFAENFVGTTNLAQRRRYQEDIAAADQYRQNEGQREYDFALRGARLRDPLKAEGLRITENRDRRNAYNAERELDLRELAVEESTKLRQFQMERAKEEELRSIREATRIEKQTAAVRDAEFALRENGVLPGTKLYAELMLGHLARNPYVRPDYHSTLIKENMRIEQDPDEVANKLSQQNPDMKMGITVGPNGTTYRLREPVEPKPVEPKPEKPVDHDKVRMALETEYEKLAEKARAAKAAKDDELYGYYNGRAADVRSRMVNYEKNLQPSATSEPIAPDRQKRLGELFGTK